MILVFSLDLQQFSIKRPEHAKQAIEEYHEGLLDEKVLVVEYDIERVELNPETEGNQKILYLNN